MNFFSSGISGNLPALMPERSRVLRRTAAGRAARPLEATYSVAEVAEHFGCGDRKLRYLLALGRKFHGCHPLKGGLWPVFKPSPKSVRITAGAIERHLAHMEKLRTDPMFSSEMKAKACALGE